MLKKILVGALIALSSFGVFGISEACCGGNYSGACCAYDGNNCCQ